MIIKILMRAGLKYNLLDNDRVSRYRKESEEEIKISVVIPDEVQRIPNELSIYQTHAARLRQAALALAEPSVMRIKNGRKKMLVALFFALLLLIATMIHVYPGVVLWFDSSKVKKGMIKEKVSDVMSKPRNGMFKNFSGDAWYEEVFLGGVSVRITYDEERCEIKTTESVCVSSIERRYRFLKGNNWFLAFEYNSA